MRLYDLWTRVERIVGCSCSGTGTLAQALAAHAGTPLAACDDLRPTGLVGAVIVCADQLAAAGREPEHPEVMALATVLLTEPVTGISGHETWPDAAQRAQDLAALLRLLAVVESG